MVTLDLDDELRRRDDGTWEIPGAAKFPPDRLRVSLSWKAIAFESDADRRRHDGHTDDIDLAEVLRRFRDDLSARGVDAPVPADDPTRDPDFIRVLQEQYVRYPTTSSP